MIKIKKWLFSIVDSMNNNGVFMVY